VRSKTLISRFPRISRSSNRDWSQRATKKASQISVSHVIAFGAVWLSLGATSWVLLGEVRVEMGRLERPAFAPTQKCGNVSDKQEGEWATVRLLLPRSGYAPQQKSGPQEVEIAAEGQNDALGGLFLAGWSVLHALASTPPEPHSQVVASMLRGLPSVHPDLVEIPRPKIVWTQIETLSTAFCPRVAPQQSPGAAKAHAGSRMSRCRQGRY